MRDMHLPLRIGFAALLGMIGYLGVQRDLRATPGDVKVIAPGVWFREGEIKDKGHCNNIWIEMKDYVIVVDANFPSGAQACLLDIKKTTAKPVKYVFDTHHHGDHAYGNPVWTRLGAITLAHTGVADEMKRYEPQRWQDTAKTRKDVAELNLNAPEPPRQTFSGDKFVLDDGTRKVEFHVRISGEVDFAPVAGDAVANGPYNYLGDGNSANWPGVIAKAERLDVTTVLPGHGPAGGKEVLTGQVHYLTELRKAVGDAIKAGRKLDDLVVKQGNRAETTIKLSESVKNWVDPQGLPAQVEVVYKEITTGKPHGEIIGGK